MKNKFLITIILLLCTTFCFAQKSIINDFINECRANVNASVESFNGESLANTINTGVPDTMRNKYSKLLLQITNTVAKLDSIHLISFKDTGTATQDFLQNFKSNLLADDYVNLIDMKVASLGRMYVFGKENSKEQLNDFIFFVGKTAIAHVHGIINWKDLEAITDEAKKEIQSVHN